jgi:probable rRNA maturation factor
MEPNPNRTLSVRNIQTRINVDAIALRRMTRLILDDLLETSSYDIAVMISDDPRMAQLNETHLGHGGTTDVITFDYNDPAKPGFLCGEIFVSVGEAQRQAKLYKTSWESEITRYVVHGLLHLAGYNDTTAVERRRMKQAEDRMLNAIERSCGNCRPRHLAKIRTS